MAKLQEFNGHYCESEYEYAFLAFLESVGWQYVAGGDIHRTYSEILLKEDLAQFYE